LSSFDEIWKKESGKESEEEKPTTEESTPSETSTEEEPTEQETSEEETLEEVVEETKPSPQQTETEDGEKNSSEDIWGEPGSAEPDGEGPSTPVPTTEETTSVTEPVVEKPKTPSEPVKPIKINEKTIEVAGEQYDLSPDKGGRKLIITDYGLKGDGKTSFALSFPGRIACLSFDRKSKQVWEEMYNKDQRIVVYDAIRYLDKTSGALWLKTADKTFKYVMLLLDEVIRTTKPDWIVIDGAEIFTKLCEMIMRYRNGLQPFQGIRNLNLWKERRMLIDQLHNKCVSIAKEGVIYTTYTSKDEVIEDGQFVARKDVPRWIDAIMLYTDVVVRVRSKSGKDGRIYTAEIESSKTKILPTGKIVDITDGGYKKVVGD
jgi:hypothetical protein